MEQNIIIISIIILIIIIITQIIHINKYTNTVQVVDCMFNQLCDCR